MCITLFIHEEGKPCQQYESLDPLSGASAEATIWVDIESAAPDELQQIATHFGLHELTVEDCLTPGHFPKLEDFGTYAFIVLRALKPWSAIEDLWQTLSADEEERQAQTTSLEEEEEDEEEKFTRKIAIYLSEKFLVTFRRREVPWFDALVRQISQSPDRYVSLGTDGLAHRIVDVMVDRFERGLDFFENIIEEIEDRSFRDPNDFDMAHVLELKRVLIVLRQIARDQRAVISKLSLDPSLPIKKQRRRYFKDIDDHSVDIMNAIEKHIDSLGGVRDAYFASANVRLGDIMRVLAVITTIAAPLNIVVGLYGMNFRIIPYSDHPFGFLGVVVFIILITAALMVLFRRKHWL